MLLFGAFLCWWTLFLKLALNLFSSIFSIPNLTAEAIFPAGRNELFMEHFILASGIETNWNHYLNWGEATFYRVTSLLLLLEANFYMFFRHSCRWKQLSGEVETYLFNESFILAGGIRIYVYRKQYCFLYSFFLLMETIISSELRFFWAEIRISLNNNFLPDRKKTSRVPRKKESSWEIFYHFFPFSPLSEKMEENGIH